MEPLVFLVVLPRSAREHHVWSGTTRLHWPVVCLWGPLLRSVTITALKLQNSSLRHPPLPQEEQLLTLSYTEYYLKKLSGNKKKWCLKLVLLALGVFL